MLFATYFSRIGSVAVKSSLPGARALIQLHCNKSLPLRREGHSAALLGCVRTTDVFLRSGAVLSSSCSIRHARSADVTAAYLFQHVQSRCITSFSTPSSRNSTAAERFAARTGAFHHRRPRLTRAYNRTVENTLKVNALNFKTNSRLFFLQGSYLTSHAHTPATVVEATYLCFKVCTPLSSASCFISSPF